VKQRPQLPLLPAQVVTRLLLQLQLKVLIDYHASTGATAVLVNLVINVDSFILVTLLEVLDDATNRCVTLCEIPVHVNLVKVVDSAMICPLLQLPLLQVLALVLLLMIRRRCVSDGRSMVNALSVVTASSPTLPRNKQGVWLKGIFDEFSFRKMVMTVFVDTWK
jgi:hypothetical protein